MAHWLMKSEPDVYSFQQLAKDKGTDWDKVRNFTARNHLKAMKVGDEALFYHSNADPSCIVGTMRIVEAAKPDATQFEPGDYHEPRATREKPYWYQVRVAYQQAFPRPVTREMLKAEPALRGMALFKYGRLSVTPVTADEWKRICALGGL